jgi:hypothetical protein
MGKSEQGVYPAPCLNDPAGPLTVLNTVAAIMGLVQGTEKKIDSPGVKSNRFIVPNVYAEAALRSIAVYTFRRYTEMIIYPPFLSQEIQIKNGIFSGTIADVTDGQGFFPFLCSNGNVSAITAKGDVTYIDHPVPPKFMILLVFSFIYDSR